MDFESYVKEALDNIKESVKEVKKNQVDSLDRFEKLVSELRNKNSDQDMAIAEMNTALAVNEQKIDTTQASLENVKKSAWGLLAGLIITVSGVVAKIVIGK